MTRLILNLLLLSISYASCDAVSLTDDPSLFPGHLKPMGSDRPQKDIEAVDRYPEPADFFANYVDKSKPLLIRGAAKSSPAFSLWKDDYLKSHKEAESFPVFVESRKKEVRDAGGYTISLKKFIETYHKTDIYMVNGVPDHLQKDVQIPSPLRCEETRKLLEDTVTWFSSGGTKSVLHNDDVDNINCLLRGKKQLLFINFHKYKSKVNIDRPDGGYSMMDVDALDFVKYPGMREVEYINATMHEGDCLFIPFQWFHQVNSWSNKDEMNVAVNVWFKHKRQHRPKKCKLTPEEATLDKYKFADLERQKKNAEKENSQGEQDSQGEENTQGDENSQGEQDSQGEENLQGEQDPQGEENPQGEESLQGQGEEDPIFVKLQMIESFLAKSRNNEMKLKDFARKFKKEPSLTKVDISSFKNLKTFEETLKPLFDAVDADKNGKINVKDFDLHEKEFTEENGAEITSQLTAIERYAADLIEFTKKGKSVKEFEASLADSMTKDEL